MTGLSHNDPIGEIMTKSCCQIPVGMSLSDWGKMSKECN